MRVLSDGDWELVEPFMPATDGKRGRRFRDHRTVGEGIIYRYRAGIAWRDLPPEPADPGTTRPISGQFAPGRGDVMSVTKGLLVRLEALPGKEDEVQEFLGIGRGLVEEEPATIAWFAIRLGPSSFGIFDVFPDDAGRDAHLSGAVAAALGEQTGTLFSEPTIEKLDVLGSKLPA
ncbi:hypothetical protein GCM10010910_30000 [Microbacterium nanhaiense]|uniref:Insertion element IS402-like domain-containing protein n=2 Tax=Microbacterium nanhaiense TaxID=1301026 RepID=A0ABQ2N6T8_9MICO|nr:hypothetical protein GCM10010910_30000 [Microbacterium nanhaiense]